MVNEKQIRVLIDRVLYDINMHSDNAVDLVYRTGMVESRYEYISQVGSGIARSFWQVESATAKDSIDNYLGFRPKKLMLCAKAMHVDSDWLADATQDELKDLLWGSIVAGIVFCRLKYWRVPHKIPNTVEGQAEYYKKYYNTETGKADINHVIDVFTKSSS